MIELVPYSVLVCVGDVRVQFEGIKITEQANFRMIDFDCAEKIKHSEHLFQKESDFF